MPQPLYLLGDELFVLGSILFSVAAFISALLAVSEEASTPSRLKVFPLGVPQLAAALVPPLPPGSVANCVTNSVQTTESPSHRTAQDGGRSPRRPKSPILRLDTPGTPLRREVSVAVASLYELGGVSFVVACLGFVPASTLGISASPTPAPLTRVGQGLALALASPGPGPSVALALAP